MIVNCLFVCSVLFGFVCLFVVCLLFRLIVDGLFVVVVVRLVGCLFDCSFDCYIVVFYLFVLFDCFLFTHSLIPVHQH